jgi:hypothetical protein
MRLIGHYVLAWQKQELSLNFLARLIIGFMTSRGGDGSRGRLLAQELLHARDRLVDRLLGGEAVDGNAVDGHA